MQRENTPRRATMEDITSISTCRKRKETKTTQILVCSGASEHAVTDESMLQYIYNIAPVQVEEVNGTTVTARENGLVHVQLKTILPFKDNLSHTFPTPSPVVV